MAFVKGITLFHPEATPRGVNSAKLQDIIAKIGPLMQPSRFQFYQDLLSSDLGDMISNQ